MLKFVLIIQLVTSCILNIGVAREQISEYDNSDVCPTSLWFDLNNGTCQCSKALLAVKCSSSENNLSLQVLFGYCMTWNGQEAVLGACPYFPTTPKYMTHNSQYYDINIDIHGQDLNNITCSPFNRQSVYCEKCLRGHGPAIFSDSFTCVKCSKYRHVWVVYFLFQLFLETALFIILALTRPYRAFSVINVLTFFWQMVLYAITTNTSLHVKFLTHTRSEVLQFLLTVYGIWNLDFTRYLMPPMCINSSTKAINTLLFDLVIALYPFMLCGSLLVCTYVHNQNNRIFSFILRPLKRILRREWNVKDSAVSTFAVFFVLGYSKLLFTCLKLLSRVLVHDKNGSTLTNQIFLYYDPSVTYLSPQHVPYIIMSAVILFTFILIPPLLLMLYPIRRCRNCINYLGFQRSEFLCKMIGTFQSSYKNGTEGTYDYRQFSALYMILRIGIACEYVFVMATNHNKNFGLPWAITGLVLIGFGAVYFTVEPFRQSWMNKFDGFILTLLGLLALTINFDDTFVCIIALVISMKPWAIIGLNILLKSVQWTAKTSAIKNLKTRCERSMKCSKNNNEEEEPLLEESLSDMPDRIVNPSHYTSPEIHITKGRATQRPVNVPTYGVV